MARIRTIKPEFPQSESMGRVSREARLMFMMLWTVSDDDGRLRASSRLLASLLYPYDDDAPGLVDGWMAELEREGCVRRYVVDGTTYAEIVNWLEHQKIDRPTASRLPSFDDTSRTIAKPREPSSTDLGPSTVDQERETRERATPLISEDAFQLADEITKAGGKQPDDPSVIGLAYEAQSWLNQGIEKNFALARASPVAAKPLKYISKTVTSSWAEYCVAPAHNPGERHAKPRKQSPLMEAVDQHIRNLAGGEDGEDIGASEGAARLLSHG